MNKSRLTKQKKLMFIYSQDEPETPDSEDGEDENVDTDEKDESIDNEEKDEL